MLGKHWVGVSDRSWHDSLETLCGRQGLLPLLSDASSGQVAVLNLDGSYDIVVKLGQVVRRLLRVREVFRQVVLRDLVDRLRGIAPLEVKVRVPVKQVREGGSGNLADAGLEVNLLVRHRKRFSGDLP